MSAVWITLGLVAATCFAIWLAVIAARRGGRAEVEAETNQRMAENAESMGKVIAEHRDPERVSDRLRDGSF